MAVIDSEVDALCRKSAQRLEALRAHIRSAESALVAFSGGVDSAFVLYVAFEQLGDKAVALTATSPSVADDELADAKKIAAHIGVQHIIVESNELDNPSYASNPSNRCYFCKSELYSVTDRQRTRLGLAAVFDGFNADDFSDHRPGHQAAREHEVKSPLAMAGLTKDEIRAWSKRFGLPTWDKPQKACLASRLPYGTQVTIERLTQIGRAERLVKELGFREFRVRHHGDVARLEVSQDELPRLGDPLIRAELSRQLKGCGYTFVAVDLEPFKSGRMNETLQRKPGVALPLIAMCFVMLSSTSALAVERYDHRDSLGLTASSGAEFLSFSLPSVGLREGFRAPIELGGTMSVSDRIELRLFGRASLGDVRADWSAYFGMRNSFGYDQLKTFFDIDLAAHISPNWALGARVGVGLQYDFLPTVGAFAALGGQLAGGSGLRLSFEAMAGLQFRSYLLE